MRNVVCVMLFSALILPGGDAPQILEQFGLDHFSTHYQRAVAAFFEAEDAYRAGKYADASAILERLWRDYPPGGRVWGNGVNEAQALAKSTGLNLGTPAGYYGLRMLSECVDWRLNKPPVAKPRTIRMTVIIVGHSTGLMPSTWAEVRSNAGKRETHDLDRAFDANAAALLEESTWLFREYISAITAGAIRVEMKIVRLPDFVAPMHVVESPRPNGFLSPGVTEQIMDAAGEQVRAATDWWFLIYPPFAPESRGDFAQTEFEGGGGMGRGLDGESPAFLCDDTSFTRKPPHMGIGPYASEELRAYYPQWFQHEFFHFLFRTHAALGLEKQSHQWFDRKTWPADFAGLIEPDYYAEALHKRLQNADPPLRSALRFAPPPKDMLTKITPEMMLGNYRQEPVENDWHIGRIEVRSHTRTGAIEDLLWINKAGAVWKLIPQIGAGVLTTDASNPYYASDPVRGREFKIVLRRNADGDCLPDVEGFHFNGALYRKVAK